MGLGFGRAEPRRETRETERERERESYVISISSKDAVCRKPPGPAKIISRFSHVTSGASFSLGHIDTSVAVVSAGYDHSSGGKRGGGVGPAVVEGGSLGSRPPSPPPPPTDTHTHCHIHT